MTTEARQHPDAEPEIFGSGDHRYQLIRAWAKFGEQFDPTAVAVDSQDRVYISQHQDVRGDKGAFQDGTTPLVTVCDPDGHILSTWGTGACVHQHGLFIANDIIYVCDKDTSKAMMYTLDGKILQILGRHNVHSETGCIDKIAPVPTPAGPFNFPTKLVPSPWGDLYVSDGYKNARVHRFTSGGELIQSWGKWGRSGPGNFHLPHSVLATADGRVYVASRFGDNVQIFDRNGEFMDIWFGVRRPTDIAELPDGTLAVSEQASDYYPAELDFDIPFGITIYSKAGDIVERLDIGQGHGISVDSKGNIYVADHHTVDKLVKL